VPSVEVVAHLVETREIPPKCGQTFSETRSFCDSLPINHRGRMPLLFRCLVERGFTLKAFVGSRWDFIAGQKKAPVIFWTAGNGFFDFLIFLFFD